MKRKFLPAMVVAAFFIISCSQDEMLIEAPQKDNAIAFSVFNEKSAQTRAYVETTERIKSAGFGVFAYYTGKENYTNNTYTSNFMFNQMVSGENWGYNPLKYWPNNSEDKISFFAYAPYNSGKIICLNNEQTSDPLLNFNVNTDVEKQVDLLWGVNEESGLPWRDATKSYTEDKIKFKFKHALSKVGFKAIVLVDQVNEDTDGQKDNATHTSTAVADGTTIAIQEVKLIGKFYKNGILNLNNVETNSPEWSVADPTEISIFTLNDVNFESVHDNVTVNASVLNSISSYLMLIPQNIENIHIKVKYTVTTEDENLAGGKSVITNGIDSGSFDFDFEAGKAYNFVLHLGMTSVKFSAYVTGWDPEDGQDDVVEVPINRK